MRVEELWRYPVKSLAGERLQETEVGMTGLPGDRRVAAFELYPHPKAKELSGRDVPQLLRYRAHLDGQGTVVAGPGLEWAPWASAEVKDSLSRDCRRTIELRAMPDGAFDSAPLLVVHLATIRALGEELGAEVDRRRFRANVYLDGEGLLAHEEPGLVGRVVRIGEVEIEPVHGCPRCSIPTRDPDTWANWPLLLRHLVAAHEEVVGVYCRVRRGGRLAEGDEVELG